MLVILIANNDGMHCGMRAWIADHRIFVCMLLILSLPQKKPEEIKSLENQRNFFLAFLTLCLRIFGALAIRVTITFLNLILVFFSKQLQVMKKPELTFRKLFLTIKN